MNPIQIADIPKTTDRLMLSLIVAIALCTSAIADTAPVVSVSVNGSASADIFPGMPVLISIWLIHPEATVPDATPILIAVQNGAWTNSIHLEINDFSANSQSWPFHTSGITSNTITLTSTNLARINRWLAPAQTLTLSTGLYTVVATLDTAGVSLPGAWLGSAKSVPAELTIRNEPSSLSQAEAENKYKQISEFYLFSGDAASSLGEANALLALFPTNITGLHLKARALIASGQFEQAGTAVGQALDEVYAQNPNPIEPPEALYGLGFELENQRVSPPQLNVTKTNNQISLKWTSYSDFIYWIESSTNLSIRGWSLLATNPPGNTYFYPADPNVEQFYFRVGRGIGGPRR